MIHVSPCSVHSIICTYYFGAKRLGDAGNDLNMSQVKGWICEEGRERKGKYMILNLNKGKKYIYSVFIVMHKKYP